MNHATRYHRARWPARERLILREHQLITAEFVNYFASVDTSWRILDVSCADGFFLEILRNLGFDQIYGMDLDPECLEIARQKGLQVFEGSIYQLDAHGQLDAVLMADILEHLDNPGLSITKVYDALREGGILYLIVPVVEHLSSRFWQKLTKLWSPRSEPPVESQELTTDSICWLLRSHQFEVDMYVRTQSDAEAEEGSSPQWLSLVASKAQGPRRIDYLPPEPIQEEEVASSAQGEGEAEDLEEEDAPTVIEPDPPR